MRPIKITMSAFGPYAGEINLNMDELGEKGLYLITGDTGAGKTTIFDAICFVLFGEASGGSREATMLRSKYAQPDTPTFVEMSFVHAGKEYYIKRNPEYMRPAKRGDGVKKELPNAELHMPDGTVITKVRDVNTAVVELLGIDRGQFSQIAMLAQGDFLKLLLADTKERQEIFRKLFKTEYYQTLQFKLEDERKKSYGICEDAKKSVKQYISGIQCPETNPLTIRVDKAKAGELFVEDVLSVIEELLSEDMAARDKAKEQIDALDKELAIVNQNIGKAQQLEKAKADLNKANSELDAELPRQQELQEVLTKAEKELPKKEEIQRQQAQVEAELPRYKEYEDVVAAAAELSNAIKAGDKAIAAASETVKEISGQQENLKKELEEYKDAGIDKEKLLAEKNNLEDRYRSLKDIAGKIAALKKDEKILIQSRDSYKKLDAEYQEKNNYYEHIFKLYRDSQAGVLAATLKEGEPCPVCGSKVHPMPADQTVAAPTDAELKEVKTEADGARLAAERASRKCGELGSSFDTNLKNILESYAKLGHGENTADCNLETISKDISNRIDEIAAKAMDIQEKIAQEVRRLSRKDEIEKVLPRLEKEIEELRKKELSLKEKLAADKSAFEANNKQSAALKESFKYESRNAAEKRILELKKEAQDIQSSFDKADKEMKAYVERVSLLKGRIKGLQETVDKSEKVELEAELGKKDELEGKRTLQNGVYTEANSRIEANEAVRTGIDRKQSELSEAEKKLAWVSSLSDTASGKLSGKEKIMLETYIQTTYFDRIIARANLRFMKMSDAQYELKRLEEAANNRGQSGLDLGVIDHYNGTQRSVKTLSGGESFMAALSLALGLSDEIQSSAGGIQIDTMFVDEGFGTLDSDSLELAYNALAGLTEGNRLVGIISHVTELKDKIDRQIVVTKEKSGGSKAVINV